MVFLEVTLNDNCFAPQIWPTLRHVRPFIRQMNGLAIHLHLTYKLNSVAEIVHVFL